MELTIQGVTPDCADGIYQISAKGFVAAALYWANKQEALPNWTPFAHIPIMADGTGKFIFTGHRGIPPGATCVLARAVSEDLKRCEEALCPLPERAQPDVRIPPFRIAAMSDLHLSRKPWQIRKALHMARDMDMVLLAGDMINDGTAEQMELMHSCIKEILADKPVLAVAGNHDYPAKPFPVIRTGLYDYPAMQEWLLQRAAAFGCGITASPCGSYAVRAGNTEIIGLNAVSHWRRFVFRDGAQLQWLDRHLSTSDAARHIILCHAPLLRHNPLRSAEKDTPYLSRDERLQEMIDAHQNIIFISGHTHISMNIPGGCVDFDRNRGNIYINDGSVRATTWKADEPIRPKFYMDGNIVELTLLNRWVEITAVSLRDERRLSRGYYSFNFDHLEERRRR